MKFKFKSSINVTETLSQNKSKLSLSSHLQAYQSESLSQILKKNNKKNTFPFRNLPKNFRSIIKES